MQNNLVICAILSLCLGGASVEGALIDTNAYLNFIRAQAAEMRKSDRPPANSDEWQVRKAKLREELLRAWGGFPREPVSLEPRKLGELQREGYRVEKIIFQTFPGVWMTANAYVPAKGGKLPAILMVHGHWRGAKQDPVVQSRCIGAARLGFFVLVVDAFGAGERGVGEALGEYHGDMTAATLLPAGIPLSGLHVYENMRAVDYLRTRAEVDPERIGITGASGGGNQTMYASAWDQRFAAAVPVCSVGNYQSYLGAACCMCEVVPGALRFTEEWQILASLAPRALMVINATRDSRQFSVEEAKVSLKMAQPVFDLMDKSQSLRHTIFESGHDYSKPMREAVYGWMTLHLKNGGDGSPIAEPEIKTEEPETLRCFPGESRPDDWITIPKFAAAEGRRLIAQKKKPASLEEWKSQRAKLHSVLEKELLGGFPESGLLDLKVIDETGARQLSFTPEQGITLRARQTQRKKDAPVMIVVDLEGAAKASASTTASNAIAQGWSLVTLDLRATGDLAWKTDKVGRAPDHTSAQWGLWIGRPLLGQWVFDIKRLLDALEKADGSLPDKISLTGIGPAGVVALAAGALDDRIQHVVTVGALTTFISEVPYVGQRTGIIVSGFLKGLGDVSDLAAMVAPRKLTLLGSVSPNGEALDTDMVRKSFERTDNVFRLAGGEFRIAVQQDNAL